MDYDLASTLNAFAMLARGNSYINKLPIGLDSPLIPPLPGKIDGNRTRGLAAHGRMEGDVSMTRQDWAIGDYVHFQPDLFAELLDIVAQVGNDSDITGPKSIVNAEALSLFKLKRFEESRSRNPELQYHFWRLLFSYGDAGFFLELFANGTEGTLSVPTLTSFLRDERFPDNWYRRSSPATLGVVGDTSGALLNANPVPPGATAPNGTYIGDSGPFTDCAVYSTMIGDNLPGVLVNTAGILKNNIDFLLNTVHYSFPNCTPMDPHGAADV
ncbi:hypothetical protein C0995_013987 [Termitomyces sp. Mi166|nr:hypothetical protein C0995_013987 [Termitomyces sp. Mi166\